VPASEQQVIHKLVEPDGKADIIQLTPQAVRRLDGATGKPVWLATLEAKDQPAAGPGKDYPGRAILWWGGFGGSFPPAIVESNGDLVLVGRERAALLALSGKTGKVLWWFQARPTLPEGVKESEVQIRSPAIFGERVLGLPVVADVDGDGVPDFLAAFDYGSQQIGIGRPDVKAFVSTKPQTWIEAVSGRTGHSLWRYDVGHEQQAGMPLHAAALTQLGERRVVAMVIGDRLLGLDLRTGGEVWQPHRLGFQPARAPQFIALGGNGPSDALLLERPVSNGVVLEALSLRTRERLWSAQTEIPLPRPNSPPGQEPIVIDLKQGGKSEVITLYRPRQPGQDPQSWATLEVRDATSGDVRWSRRLGLLEQFFEHPQTAEQHPQRVIVGPDLDGDGYRELFVATVRSRKDARSSSEGGLFVDALSGRDGHTLWWSQADATIRFQTDLVFGTLSWGQVGPDGWPLLLVPCFQDRWLGWETYTLAAATGRVQARVPGFRALGVADLNRDGLPDLYGTAAEGTMLRAFRGAPPEPWRLLGNAWQPGQDFDGDGIADVIDTNDPEHTTALSGDDGHRLWQADIGGLMKVVPPLPDGDLDGDGVADVLLVANSTSSWQVTSTSLRALSGRTGKPLWSSAAIAESPHGINVSYLRSHRMTAEGPPDVLLSYFLASGSGPFSGRRWMARLDGRSGKVAWNEPLHEPLPTDTATGLQLQPALADLDGDGVLDLILLVPVPGSDETPSPGAEPNCGLRAYSGRDGRLLWVGPQVRSGGGSWPMLMGFSLPRPAVGPTGEDGAPVIAVTTYGQQEDGPAHGTTYCEVLVLSGKDGRLIWRWRGDDARNLHIDRWDAVTPQRVNLDTGAALCVMIHDFQLTFSRDPRTGQNGPTGKSGFQLVLLDFIRGTVLQRRDLPEENPGRAPFWVQDLDGDGKDEVLYLRKGELHALRGGIEGKPWWTWTFPGQGGSVLRIEPARQGHPGTVVVLSGDSIYGLDGSTGRPRWRCDVVPTPGNAQVPQLLPATDPQGLPHVLFAGPSRLGPSTLICRQALPASPTGEYLLPQARRRPDDGVPPDPRLIRPLPWGMLLPYLDIMEGAQAFAVLFVGLIVPGWLMRRAWRQRSWKLALLPVLWLGILCLWASIQYGTAALRPGLVYLGGALVVGVPALLFVGLVGGAVFRRRWRRLGLLLAVGLLVTLVHAGVWLAIDARGMDPAEHYSWEGWYAMLLIGAYEAGVLLLGVLCLVGLYRVGRWLVSRARRRVRPA
jgi:outer membrane protein assembly factor BamB